MALVTGVTAPPGITVRGLKGEDATVVEVLVELDRQLQTYANGLFAHGQAEVPAEDATRLREAGAVATLARRHLQDARSRYTEARARELDVFSPADIDRRTAKAEREGFHAAIDAAGPSGAT